MIKVSASAKNKVRVLMKEEGFDPNQAYVRVGVKSGGCSGLSYELNFDDKTNNEDIVFGKTVIFRIIVPILIPKMKRKTWLWNFKTSLSIYLVE